MGCVFGVIYGILVCMLFIFNIFVGIFLELGIYEWCVEVEGYEWVMVVEVFIVVGGGYLLVLCG